MIDDSVDLSRSEVAHLASYVQSVVDARGSRAGARELLGIQNELMSKILKRPGALSISRRSLRRISEAMQVPIAELTRGAAS